MRVILRRKWLAICALAALLVAGLFIFRGDYQPPSAPIPTPQAKSRLQLGNFDLATQALIARARRVVFLVPFSHWDTDWHQDFTHYSLLSDQDILQAIQLAKQYPRFRFTLEQALFVQHFWNAHPEARADLVALVHDHQISFAWAGITQPETSLAAPAVQMHNLQLGQAWIAQTFGPGYIPRTAWQSDAFGNSAAFPTFLAQFGIPYLFIGRYQGRCDPDYESCQALPPEFNWTSPAAAPGTAGRVLVAYVSYPLAWGDIYQRTDPNAQLAQLRQTINSEFNQTSSNYLFLPVGFDFFAPQANLMALVERWNAADPATALVISDPDSAFQYISTQTLPEITTDLNPIWQAFYDTRPAAKIADIESEFFLSAADKFGLLTGAPAPETWNLAAFNTHYDNISGVSFDSVWQGSQLPRFNQAVASAKDELAAILSRIAAGVSAPVVVFNPLSWSRSGIVELSGSLPDASSLPGPVQKIGTNTLAFRVENVPSLGYLGLKGGQSTIDQPVRISRQGDLITLANGLVSVTLDGDHGGAFSSLAIANGPAASRELLSAFGDDVTYWDDSGDVYGASFGQVRARESKVPARLDILASGPLVARLQAVFTLGGQPVVKTVTMHADDPLVEVDLDIQALPETTAIVETPTILDAATRTDDLGFGAFDHPVDTQPIVPGDSTYRRAIFYPIVYWSDVSTSNVGLTIITHGLQGVGGGATRSLMLVRQVTKDPEGVTDPGIHHLSYAYLAHTGTATQARPWLAAYEFNQPLIVAWKSNTQVTVQLPFDGNTPARQFNNESASPAMPASFSLLSARNAVVADLYQPAGALQALIVDYDPSSPASLQVGQQQMALPGSPFTLFPVSLGSLALPPLH
ncbi:MAG: glycoside hydrolase family 38 C-terminal domain-containing protein [Anaerolineales bacterium]